MCVRVCLCVCVCVCMRYQDTKLSPFLSSDRIFSVGNEAMLEDSMLVLVLKD